MAKIGEVVIPGFGVLFEQRQCIARLVKAMLGGQVSNKDIVH